MTILTHFGAYTTSRPRLTKYCRGCVPGIPGGVDACAQNFPPTLLWIRVLAGRADDARICRCVLLNALLPVVTAGADAKLLEWCRGRY